MDLAFYNDQKIKNKYLKRVQKHYELDEIIQGVYWKNGKGCAVGCIVEKNDNAHEALEKELAIPQSIAYLADKIFEGLTNGDAKKFPLEFLRAIKPGADLSKVEYKFKLWLLVDKHNGVIQYANEETKKIIKQIAKLQKQAAKGDMPSDEKWSAAWSAAWSAVWSARSAAESARSAESVAWSARSARSAESVAWSAVWSARSAAWSAESAVGLARSAVWSAAWSAAWSAGSAGSAAWSAAYKAQAKKLLSLLKEA